MLSQFNAKIASLSDHQRAKVSFPKMFCVTYNFDFFLKVEKISNGIIPNFHYRARNCQFRESKMFKSLYIFNSLLHLRDTMIPCSLIKSRIGYLFEIWIIYFNTKSECVFSKACHLKNHKRNHKIVWFFKLWNCQYGNFRDIEYWCCVDWGIL